MSLEAMVDVWRHSRAEKSARLVMLALGNEVRPSHGRPICWPGKGSLARQTRLDERTVDRKISELAAMGEVVIVPDSELDMYVKHSLEKSATSNLYILCPGYKPAAIARVREWLGGGKMPPVKMPPDFLTRRGGHPVRQGGGHPDTHRTGEHVVDPEKQNRRENTLFAALPEWAGVGVRATWEDGTNRWVGEIVERDGGLAFSSRDCPYSTPPLARLAATGTLTQITGTPPPDLVDVEAGEAPQQEANGS